MSQSASVFAAQRIHFVGIKGVGMTPVALMLQDLGKEVSGSDSLDTQITDEVLAKRRISVKEFNPANILESIDLVIYSGAYKQDHPELIKAKQLEIHCITQAEALAQLTKDKQLIAVCGVGGKTTTSAMLSTIFQRAKVDPSWFVGVSSFNNDWLPGKCGSGDYFIAEADEYAISPENDTRPKFALYSPKIIVCTNLLHDHPDIYPTFDDTIKIFVEFFNKLPEDGLLIIRPKDLELVKVLLTTKAKVITYDTIENSAEYQVLILPDESFYIQKKNVSSKTIFMTIVGEHNILNATAAYLASKACGLDETEIVESLQSFNSSKRRLEKIGYKDEVLYYDDYGHHPYEIQHTLKSLKKRYLDKRLITIFNPHTFSRTKALFSEYSTAFNDTDILIIDEIFSSAREISDSSVSGEILAEAIKKYNPNTVYLSSREKIIEYIKLIQKPGDVILTLGAGDIYKIHEELLKS